MNKLKNNLIQKLIDSGIEKNEAIQEFWLLFEFVTEFSKKDYLLNPNLSLELPKLKRLENLVNERVSTGTPIQYLMNKAFFMGLEFFVDKNVLIPRPETELLVSEIEKLAKNILKIKETVSILDIGVGSGCIDIVLAKNIEKAQVLGVDISQEALKIAEKNAQKHEIVDKITFLKSDIFENVNNKFDLIVSNPPYISPKQKKDLQKEVLEHEPHLALFTEDNEGVEFYKEIILQSKKYLNTGGYIAFELGINQSQIVKDFFEKEGFKDIEIVKDFNDIDRIIIARL